MASPVAAGGLPCNWLELAVAVRVGQGQTDAKALITELLPNVDPTEMEAVAGKITTLIEANTSIWRRFGVI
jgi:hypothetical protein